jgi:hypothetical protein
MSATAKTYRANASRARVAASQETLASRQAIHERSAMAWDAMAQLVEDTEQLAGVNAAAKALLKEASFLLANGH